VKPSYSNVATVPPGEWLGSSADDGRAKLRKAVGSRTEAKNYRSPNGNPHRNCFAQWGTPRIETSQYRQEQKANAMSLVTASEHDTVQTEALTGNVVSGLTFIIGTVS
jgi:hypothetical protein